MTTTTALTLGKNETLIPHNMQAEQSLLGALLLNNASLEHVSDFLKPEHFSDSIHGRIYEAISRLIDRGQIADPITLRDFFDKDQIFEPVGGAKYLIDLASSVISIISVGDYGRLIYDLYLRRQLIDIGEQMVNDSRSHDLEIPATQHIENSEKKLYDLATKGQFSSSYVVFSDVLANAIQTAEIAFLLPDNSYTRIDSD